MVMSPEAQFREMFNATYPVVVRYARHRGVSGHDLEDLVSATFEVAWRRFDQFPAGDRALPWLLGVAQNHLRSHRRRLARDRGLLQRLSAPDSAHAAAAWSRCMRKTTGHAWPDENALITAITGPNGDSTGPSARSMAIADTKCAYSTGQAQAFAAAFRQAATNLPTTIQTQLRYLLARRAAWINKAQHILASSQ
jgi:RNA polymerase sigma factor (sigma-70 family)